MVMTCVICDMREVKLFDLSSSTVHSLYSALAMIDCRVMYSIKFRDWIKIIFVNCRINMALFPGFA